MSNIVQTLMVSTGNVLHKDMLLLKEEKNFSVGCYEFGAYIFVPSEEHFNPEPDDSLKKYSDVFSDILRYAAKMGCLIINFDADNDYLPGFPVFEW